MKVDIQATGYVLCAVDGCPNASKKAGLCWGHYKRKMRGQAVHVPLADPRGGRHKRGLAPHLRLRREAIRYADVSGDERRFDRAAWNLEDAARAYALSLGWKPPRAWKRWMRRLKTA